MQRWIWPLLGLGLCLILLGAWLGRDAAAEEAAPVQEQDRLRPSGLRFPQDFRQHFVRYLRVERSDGTIRDLYINPESLEHFRRGQALPNNTTIVVDSYYAQPDPAGRPRLDEAGHFLAGEAFEMLHVIQKRDDWQAQDFPSSARIEDWNFGSFDAAGQPFPEALVDCFHCHNAAFATDFLYTYPQLSSFSSTGQAGYFFCDLPDRLPCKD